VYEHVAPVLRGKACLVRSHGTLHVLATRGICNLSLSLSFYNDELLKLGEVAVQYLRVA